MREYLPRDELVEEYQNTVEPLIVFLNGETKTAVLDENVLRFLSTFPAADVRSVVPGKLIPSREHPGYLVCSVCHDCYVDPSFVKDNKWNFCPQCGTPWKRDKKPDNSEFIIPNSEFEGGRGNG